MDWHPVSEPPKNTADVVILDADRALVGKGWYYREDNEWVIYNGPYSSDNITHWTEFEPPNKKED